MAATTSHTALEEMQNSLDIVDAIVAAVDVNRSDEIERLRSALETVGLAEMFRDEMRLAGVPSVCNGECWSVGFVREAA